jgi:hypothetical protein
MVADEFFNRRRLVRERNKIEDERFTLTRKEARRRLTNESAKIARKSRTKNPTLPLESKYQFKDWQIELAERVGRVTKWK